jgi:hypothetical protein
MFEVVRTLSELNPTRSGSVMKRNATLVGVFLVAGTTLVLGSSLTSAVQNETHEEKAANLKQQALGGLFKKWTFDQDPLNALHL